jgi:hypothetical protein
VLRQAGLIECRRQGKHRFYRLSRHGWQCVQTLLGDLAEGMGLPPVPPAP